MFDVGWTELVVIGVVALIVIGPKDLPEMFRTLGRFTAKLRAMSREFQRAMETAADEAGVKDVAKDLKNVASPKNLGLDAVKDAAAKFEKWDPMKVTPKPPAAAAPAAAAPVAATPVMGPATAALAEKQAAKKKILAEAGEKLRAVDAPPVEAAKPRGRTRKTTPKADA